MITCRLCNKRLAVITNTHLRSAHNIGVMEYAAKFGSKGVGFLVNVTKLSNNDPRRQKWLRSLKNRPEPWNKGQTKESNLSIAKMAKTFKEKGIDNFAGWRKMARRIGRYPFIKHPPLKHNENSAYLIGMILGDGHIQKLERAESLRITLGTDKPLLWQHTARVVKMIFNKNPHIYRPPYSNCVVIGICRKDLSKNLQIPTGARKELEIHLPNWIWQNKIYLVSCLKGLFEAEGSFSIHLPTCTYNLQFSNKNFSLLNEVENALVKLGFRPERRTNSVRLRKKEESLRFANLISFRKFDRI